MDIGMNIWELLLSDQCNIPVSICRLLAIWLAVRAFSKMVSTSTLWSEGSRFVPHSSSLLCVRFITPSLRSEEHPLIVTFDFLFLR